MKPLVGTAPDAAALEAVTRTVRARVAFYLSTPSHRPAFEIHGWGELARSASELSRAGRWEELAAVVDDDMLHEVATIATYDRIADTLRARYRGRVDRIEFSIPAATVGEAATLRRLLDAIRR
jgi:hypothetical protein